MDLKRFPKGKFLTASESVGRRSWEKFNKIRRINTNTKYLGFILKYFIITKTNLRIRGDNRGDKEEEYEKEKKGGKKGRKGAPEVLNKIKYLYIFAPKGGTN